MDNWQILNRFEMLCKTKGLTESSIEAFCRTDLPLFIRFLGNKQLETVTHYDVEDFLQYCMIDRKNCDATLSRKFVSLNSFFNTLIKKGYLNMSNPLDKIDKVKVRKKIPDHLTREEVFSLIDYAQSKHDLRGCALMHLLFSSAIRLKECYQLNRDSIDFDRLEFKVLGKNDKERICIISEQAKISILAYLDSRKDNLKPLFISKINRRWSRESIQSYLRELGIKYGISKRVHPHIYRHSRAMDLLLQGASLEVIQLVLGHESISTTQIYAHQSLNQIRHVVDAIDRR